ncbi:MAG: helix-turn-helix transcriptional regulator [Candidatus Marinimicrobia bacterium]|jgi:transcriptional regulator with XRE-family HTH domain|nr:helix-turn-helix transcriptional regulator [Candidatus Neomarinimicrobiota bacterium]MBT3575241.1 helix-turn-helix transcriptional regulator [Candidatus Neomarinimicrobiota bacterium]MBT3680340.1 helix-turn-helix transcriptional regulator [Candidatus Neomarinimicrobiota bacterium]MBT3951769.1 helix-turn-helix transcriptional regulator [Candidatus Neomarinimicrobiota bacterium]MBT4252797.1 helix-turn-helix transcriptional regulator [Candidatus Neomarinimicrobiota bacterium]
MSPVAERLREFRAAVGLTQREVASLCGLGKRTIIYWEMGDREIKCTKLVPLSEEYDLDFNWLILGKGSMFNDVADPAVVEPDEVDEELEEVPDPIVEPVDQQWVDTTEPLQKEQEDVLPLIQRLRRK